MNHDERHFKWRAVTILTILQAELRTNDFILYGLRIMGKAPTILPIFFPGSYRDMTLIPTVCKIEAIKTTSRSIKFRHSNAPQKYRSADKQWCI